MDCQFFTLIFSEQSKYENHFDEMDYVIGTALHEADHMKELHMSRQAAKSLEKREEYCCFKQIARERIVAN